MVHDRNQEQTIQRNIEYRRNRLREVIEGREREMLLRAEKFGNSLMTATSVSLTKSAKKFATKTLNPTHAVSRNPLLTLSVIASIGFLGGIWLGKNFKKQNDRVSKVNIGEALIASKVIESHQKGNQEQQKAQINSLPKQRNALIEGVKEFVYDRVKEIAIGYATDYAIRMLGKTRNEKRKKQ
ncbi:MAG: hypothetical protein SFU91_10185 [Chloroherpetonaceae bacterium]|nr:hypothetical protein [Chloroherpetonaceae bacterium]